MRRTQIYLEDGQTARLDRRAEVEGVTRSTVIRRAVDEYLSRAAGDDAHWRDRWRAAVAATAGIAPYLPDGIEFVDEIREADARRLRGLDA